MKHKTKSALSLLLSLVLCLSLLPVGARAEGWDDHGWTITGTEGEDYNSSVFEGLPCLTVKTTSCNKATIANPNEFTNALGLLMFTSSGQSLTLNNGSDDIATLAPDESASLSVDSPLTVMVAVYKSEGNGWRLLVGSAGSFTLTPKAGLTLLSIISGDVTVPATSLASGVDLGVLPTDTGTNVSITILDGTATICSLSANAEEEGFDANVKCSGNTVTLSELSNASANMLGVPDGEPAIFLQNAKLTLPNEKTLKAELAEGDFMSLTAGVGLFDTDSYQSGGTPATGLTGYLSADMTSGVTLSVNKKPAAQAAAPVPRAADVYASASGSAVYARPLSPGKVYAAVIENTCDGFGTQFLMHLHSSLPATLIGGSTQCEIHNCGTESYLTFSSQPGAAPILSDAKKSDESFVTAGGVAAGSYILNPAGKNLTLKELLTGAPLTTRQLSGKAKYTFGSALAENAVDLQSTSSKLTVWQLEGETQDPLYANNEAGKITSDFGEIVRSEEDSGDFTNAVYSVKSSTPAPAPEPAPQPRPRPQYGGNNDDYEPAPTFTQSLPGTQEFPGGVLRISPTNVAAGDTVTVTAVPNEGCELRSLTVKRVNGTVPVPATETGVNVFEFTMPGVQIGFEAVFEPVAATAPAQPATPVAPAGPPKVVLSPQRIMVNGVEATVEAYNIGGTNFFKLRDLAALLAGTPAQFNVDYDASRNAVVATKGAAYPGAVGTDFKDNSASAQPSPQTVFVDGAPVALTAYNIGGSNFFGLRELAAVFGYTVDYDAKTNTAIIESK